MKKLVTTPVTNTIWWADINESNGTMNTKTRKDVTDDAVGAVLTHLMDKEDFKNNGLSGYEYNINNSIVSICAVKKEEVVCVKRKYYEELLEYKSKYTKSKYEELIK